MVKQAHEPSLTTAYFFGFAYGKFKWRLGSLLDRLPGLRRRSAQPRLRIARPPREYVERDLEMDRVDELLEKIYVSGKESLTDDERELLQRASDRLRRRRD